MSKIQAYRLVIGYIQLTFTDTGEVIKDGKKFPITSLIVLGDSREIIQYLANEQDIYKYELLPIKEPLIYLKHELN